MRQIGLFVLKRCDLFFFPCASRAVDCVPKENSNSVRFLFTAFLY